MQIEARPLAAIKPYEQNSRINDAAVDAVVESIRRFGFRQPIVVDADGVIVCGHTRWKAAQKLGLVEVPVHVARDLTPDQIRVYRIADNKTAELAMWNTALLSIELSERSGRGVSYSNDRRVERNPTIRRHTRCRATSRKETVVSLRDALRSDRFIVHRVCSGRSNAPVALPEALRVGV